MLKQILAHIVGVNVPRLSLLPAGPLHLDHADGPDVGAGLGFVKPCRGFEGFAVFDRLQQGAAPVAARLVQDVKVELDHLLGVEFPAQDLDEHVRALGRSGRKLDDHAGVESFERLLRVGAVRLVSLVEDDERPQQPHRVPEGCLDVAAPETRRFLEGVEIGVLLQHLGVRGRIVVRGEEPVEAPAVAEHPERVLRLPVGGREHEQKNAEVLSDIARAEGRGFLEDARALTRRQIELLAVWVVAVLEGVERLVVDLRRGHDPQHQAAATLPEVRVHEIDHAGREQRLAASGRDLEAERGKMLAEPVPAGLVTPSGYGPVPCSLHPVRTPVRVVFPRLFVLGPPLHQLRDEAAGLRDRTLLVFLQDHRSSLSMAS